MEGVRVFTPADWESSGTDATSYAAEDLKKCLEGLARHLFGTFLNIPLSVSLPKQGDNNPYFILVMQNTSLSTMLKGQLLICSVNPLIGNDVTCF